MRRDLINPGCRTLSPEQILELREYSKTHTLQECSEHFFVSVSTIRIVLITYFNTYCGSEIDGILSDEEWLFIKDYIQDGGSLTSAVRLYGKGRSKEYIRDGLISRFGADYAHILNDSRGFLNDSRGSNILTLEQLENLKEYRKTHTLNECAACFGVAPCTVRRHTGYKEYPILTDEDWLFIKEYIQDGGKLSNAVRLYGKGRSKEYIKNGLVSRFGADYAHILNVRGERNAY